MQSLKSRHLFRSRSLAVAIAVSLVGCRGDSSGGSGGQNSITSPAPTPSPPAPPPPPPTQSPAAPARTIAGASPGDTLVGIQTCARDGAVRDSEGHVIGLTDFTSAKIDNFVTLKYVAVDSFELDLNGFGGPSYVPADKRTSPDRAYDQFLNRTQGEFFLFKDGGPFGSFTFATLGLDNSSGLCFFAVGLQPSSLPNIGSDTYFARADGIAKVDGQLLRLFGTEGRLDVNYETGAALLELTINGRGHPFADFTGQVATSIATVRATLQLRERGGFSASLSGSNGYTGSVTGMLVSNERNVSGRGGAGAVLTFELRNSQGEVMTGAIAAERNLI